MCSEIRTNVYEVDKIGKLFYIHILDSKDLVLNSFDCVPQNTIVKDESGSSNVSGSSPSKEQPSHQSIGLLFKRRISFFLLVIFDLVYND